VPTSEHAWAQEAIDSIAEIARKYINLDAILKICDPPPCRPAVLDDSIAVVRTDLHDCTTPSIHAGADLSEEEKPIVGIIRDSAFQFYYPENLEALESAGAQLVYTSPLSSAKPPEIDALYIGGGFPETHAQDLARNFTYRETLRVLADSGLPIYAECGGLMYLGKELILEDQAYEMTGVLPLTFGFSKRPKGHGYTILKVIHENPYYPVGSQIKGHEFHYSSVLNPQPDDAVMAFEVERGTGIWPQRDGFCYKNVLATYTHVHASGTPQWAGALVLAARKYRRTKSTSTS
jgi:cobyrinic acid a,c-diamide synthase